MVGNFEQQYFDVLRLIEQTIHAEHTSNPSLADFQVAKVLESLERTYSAEKKMRPAPALKLNEQETRLFEALQQTLGLYLGRNPDIQLEVEDRLTVDEMIACIKRIERSVHLMRDKGRQGYLHFIANFFMG
jgi:hypothetical protein